METTSFETTVELNGKDRRNAMLYNVFLRRKWVCAYVSVFILFSLLVLAAGIFKFYAVPELLFYIAAAFLLLLGGLIATMVFSSQGATSKRWLSFSPEGFCTTAKESGKTLSYKWRELYYFGKTGNYFYIYIDASQFIIVPKRYLQKEEIKMLNKYV